MLFKFNKTFHLARSIQKIPNTRYFNSAARYISNDLFIDVYLLGEF